MTVQPFELTEFVVPKAILLPIIDREFPRRGDAIGQYDYSHLALMCGLSDGVRELLSRDECTGWAEDGSAEMTYEWYVSYGNNRDKPVLEFRDTRKKNVFRFVPV